MSKVSLYIASAISRPGKAIPLLAAVLLLLFLDGCATNRPVATDAVEVEGMVTVRGNEPFTELVLQTRESNYYVLKFETPEERARMQNMSPAAFAVAGDVYRDVWGSRAYAHLRVRSWGLSAER